MIPLIILYLLIFKGTLILINEGIIDRLKKLKWMTINLVIVQ